mmetsp:Transcript_10893/g.23478  ORF Transcript_10893/g.23478 Transcript_10893/m.23478 type:complete len:119 (-) Transcript_10893:1681-2037(-)
MTFHGQSMDIITTTTTTTTSHQGCVECTNGGGLQLNTDLMVVLTVSALLSAASQHPSGDASYLQGAGDAAPCQHCHVIAAAGAAAEHHHSRSFLRQHSAAPSLTLRPTPARPCSPAPR